ncbi:hypothetical protein RJ640_029733 [Escallonia rubra]|uniref:Uncharacterized protein n=1 Tax=Escallonia rubra TaxID=112253 RepID=A0AA88RJS4_9ASTE|nr:hypothetical protein RJ640_029733 [Escallonia rubra]
MLIIFGHDQVKSPSNQQTSIVVKQERPGLEILDPLYSNTQTTGIIRRTVFTAPEFEDEDEEAEALAEEIANQVAYILVMEHITKERSSRAREEAMVPEEDEAQSRKKQKLNHLDLSTTSPSEPLLKSYTATWFSSSTNVFYLYGYVFGDPSMNYPWATPQDTSQLEATYLKYPWAKPEDYDNLSL